MIWSIVLAYLSIGWAAWGITLYDLDSDDELSIASALTWALVIPFWGLLVPAYLLWLVIRPRKPLS